MSNCKIVKQFKNAILITSLSLMSVSIAYGNTEYKVKSSDSLSRIVDKFYNDSKLSRDQLYIGILAENPNAFSFGNINYLKAKQLLMLPSKSDLLVMEKDDATNLVAEHNGNARQTKKVKMTAPFQGYTPKNISNVKNGLNSISEKQQMANQALENLTSETEELRLRLERLEADKEAMDAELNQLNSLLKTDKQ